MFEFALAELGKVSSADKRQDHVCWESLFNRRFNTECVRCVDEDASMLRRDNRVDYRCKVVHVWQSLNA